MPFPLPQMFPYSWFVIFSISVLAFFFINSSWGSFYLSPLSLKKKETPYSPKTNFWL